MSRDFRQVIFLVPHLELGFVYSFFFFFLFFFALLHHLAGQSVPS